LKIEKALKTNLRFWKEHLQGLFIKSTEKNFRWLKTKKQGTKN